MAAVLSYEPEFEIQAPSPQTQQSLDFWWISPGFAVKVHDGVVLEATRSVERKEGERGFWKSDIFPAGVKDVGLVFFGNSLPNV